MMETVICGITHKMTHLDFFFYDSLSTSFFSVFNFLKEMYKLS